MKINGYYVIALILGLSAIIFVIFKSYSNGAESPASSSLGGEEPQAEVFQRSKFSYFNGDGSPAASQTITPLEEDEPAPTPASHYVTQAHMQAFEKKQVRELKERQLCNCIKQCIRPRSLELSE